MPGLDNKSSWVDQMEDEDEEQRMVEVSGDTKKVTEIRTLNNNKRVKVVQHFRTEKRKVSRNVAKRKTWAKFGQSKDDPPGPNNKTTNTTDEVFMEFLHKQEDEQLDESQFMQKGINNQTIQCRNCGLNHWTLQCPYKDKINALGGLGKPENEPGLAGLGGQTDAARAGGMGLMGRPGAIGGIGAGPLGRDPKRLDLSRNKDENNTIRITNLPEETQDSDIRDLFKDFGRIIRIFLAKDKATGNSKGFAFVSFESRESAQRAIRTVNGHGYNNLILSVEWARPSNN